MLDKLDKHIVVGNEIDGKIFKQYTEIHIHTYNLVDVDDKKVGLKKAQEISTDVENCDDIFVIAGGGDGSICWLIEELVSFNINFQRVTYGFLPLGSGNDFSIATGFGDQWSKLLASNPYQGILERIKLWLDECDRKLFDIWDTEIVFHPNGCIRKVVKTDKGFTKEPISYFDNVSGEDKNCSYFKRKMSNYLSIGIDARIGFGFDKSRTNSKPLNKVVYAWEGVKKFLSKSSNMNDVIESMSIVDEFQPTTREASVNNGNQYSVQKLKQIIGKSTPITKKTAKVFDFKIEPDCVSDYRIFDHVKKETLSEPENNHLEFDHVDIDVDHIRNNAKRMSAKKNMDHIISNQVEQIETPNQNKFNTN